MKKTVFLIMIFSVAVSGCLGNGYRVFENQEIIFHYPASWSQVSFIHPPGDVDTYYEYAVTVAEPGGELDTVATVEKLKANRSYPTPEGVVDKRNISLRGYPGVEFSYPENGSMVRVTIISTPLGRYAIVCRASEDFEGELENFDLIKYSFRVK
ncbi:hypothetical protein C7452_0854 [Methanothermobacter defluvii]|uniref:PsbP protein n=1 Tax=Methanothermobacter defluvii TaxID=49339 RepID=A0A371NFT9_9EURY|nr:hypothetical protein [Methanothermobacter defluvii]REE28830.1 hypothetical protein C7452_0854 [Methanothermobacter defluvii]